MKVGIGSSDEADGWLAGQRIAQQAVERGGIGKASFGIAFCSLAVDAQGLLAGIQALIGADVPVLGGSAIGVITNDSIAYGEHSSGLLLVEDLDIQVTVSSAAGLDQDEFQVGRALAAQLPLASDAATLLFYDSIRQPAAPGRLPVMNSSTPLLRGMAAHLGAQHPIIGGGTIADFHFAPTIQFIGDRVASQSAAALSLRGDFDLSWAIMHGCTLKDGLYYRITKIDGAVIHELDGRPIVEIINEMYGGREWQAQLPIKRLTIGVNQGERFPSEFVEADYVNRLILGVLPDESGIVMFEPDLEVGTEIQFMLRDADLMSGSVRANTERLIERLKSEGKRPLWGFYIDCAGRTALFSEALEEEAAELQAIFNREGIPLFGFFSGVEIAPFRNQNRGLDWTGVLAVFSR